MDGTIQATAEQAPKPLTQWDQDGVRKRVTDSEWLDEGLAVDGKKVQRTEERIREDSSSSSREQFRDPIAGEGRRWSVMKGPSMLHTAVESFAFYLYLAFLPGWLGGWLSKVPPFAFWSPSIVGAVAFWSALKLWGPLLSCGAMTEPCSALLKLRAARRLARHAPPECIKTAVATLGAAATVGVALRVFFPGQLADRPPVTLQIYNDIQLPAGQPTTPSTSGPFDPSASMFSSVLASLPLSFQEEVARLVSASLVSVADVAVVFRKLLVGALWAGSTWVLPRERQDALLRSELFVTTFGGGHETGGGFVDIVHRLGGPGSKDKSEVVFWFSKLVDVFLGEFFFSCLHYMVQAADIAVQEITRSCRIKVTGFGNICLNDGTLAYMVGRPFCTITGGPMLNPCFVVMVMIGRGDFFALWLLLTADFSAAFVASLLVKPARKETDNSGG
ncbi:hypothetical protein BESB_028500 [Besnoitia besnoiti]|uniref:Transmembrane protein n=1 Tax=Besnoitia besnoiti TaxID=94643 RepID=A0A2A9M0B4_BESBE|nr:uncharacterized protein BESB_028500 [Besnoitia besnoiti]PFH31415.1 hypothetical protein BESB_028500 [Besnoitia besnoiti]